MNRRVEAARNSLVKLAALPGPPSETGDLDALLTAANELTSARQQTLDELGALSSDEQALLARHSEARDALTIIGRKVSDWERAMARGRESASNRVLALRKLRQRRRQR